MDSVALLVAMPIPSPAPIPVKTAILAAIIMITSKKMFFSLPAWAKYAFSPAGSLVSMGRQTMLPFLG
jgi:hypothetical protein